MKKFFSWIFIIVLSVFICGCESQQYYRAKAVERARKFAIPQLGDLKQTQLDYIRYTAPRMMLANIFTRELEAGEDSRNIIVQVCIVWHVPGLEYDIIVFGTGERWMYDWTPYQLIRKQYRYRNAAKYDAIKQSVEYVMNNMLYLSDEERNWVRFSTPEFVRTNFDIKEKMAKRWEKALGQEMPEGFIQLSLVWKTDNNNEKIVITGMGYENMDGWMPMEAFVMTKASLDEHTEKAVEVSETVEKEKHEEQVEVIDANKKLYKKPETKKKTYRKRLKHWNSEFTDVDEEYQK